MNYLLSIIIPTKNRSYYCLYAVKQILSLGLSNIEICVQDNSDTDDLKIDIESLNCSNIVYNYHPGILSFVDNFSEAVSISNGEYVCMIGDDDGILPEIIDYAELAKKDNLDAIIPLLGFVYHWPSTEIVEDAKTGLLLMMLRHSKFRMVNPLKGLKRLLTNAIQDYTSFDIPRLYHGIVRRSVLDAIKNKTGVYFGGLTPDMFMAAELALECNRVLKISDSITISGICPKSGSADSATGRHTGELSSAPHFRGHDSYEWDNRVPAFYSVDTIWADTLFHALSLSGRGDLIKLFNMPLFEAICLKRYPDYERIINNHAQSNHINKFSMSLAYSKYMMSFFIKKVINKFERVIRKRVLNSPDYYQRIKSVPDIINAVERIESYRKECGVS